jgi:hypothetical protein
MNIVEVKEPVCVNCGGKIDRTTMCCPYCGTQYEREHKEKQTTPIYERKQIIAEYEGRGVQKLFASVRVDGLSRMGGDMEEERVKDMLCKALAKGLRDYVRISVMDDPVSFSKVANGMIMVVDTR